MIKWSINLSTLLLEHPFLDRFQAAADLGFAAVEFLWPQGIDLDDLVKAQQAASVAVALFNTDGGDLAAGERGFLGNPAKAQYLRENFHVALDLAQALECPLVHVLGGTAIDGATREAMLAEATRAQCEICALAAPRGVTITLEALNRKDIPGFLFPGTALAVEQLRRVDWPNLKLQYDVYHMQRTEGDIIATIRTHLADIAHIQIADVPGRHQPGTGELKFPAIFRAIEDAGYTGYVGLEYLAEANASTADALAWLPLALRETCSANMIMKAL